MSTGQERPSIPSRLASVEGAAGADEPSVIMQAWRSPPEHPRRVLVADDESLSAASVMMSLRQLGYQAIGPAHDGEHAIELAFSTCPDMALLDARMDTEEDGIHAARAMFLEMLIPVVIVSAYSNPRQISGAARAGVFGYLVKPVTKDQLGPAIEVAWARFNQYLTSEVEAGVLRRHLADRQDIDRAKWVLVERESLDEGEAMRELRRRAKAAGTSAGEVARGILRGGKE
jgi:response regulator NasT